MWFRRHDPETESVQAVKDAKKRLEETQARSSKVAETSRSLRMIRERNGFAEDMKILMGGHVEH